MASLLLKLRLQFRQYSDATAVVLYYFVFRNVMENGLMGSPVFARVVTNSFPRASSFHGAKSFPDASSFHVGVRRILMERVCTLERATNLIYPEC